MAYASVGDLTDSINEDSLPSELMEVYVLENALEDASALILSYIAVAYDQLLPPYDRAIKRKCIDIAYYYLMNKRGFNPSNPQDVTVYNEYNTAIAYLKDVQKNRVILADKNDSPNNILNVPFVDSGVS